MQMDELGAGSSTMDTTEHNSHMDSHVTNQNLSDGLDDTVANDEDLMQDLIRNLAP